MNYLAVMHEVHILFVDHEFNDAMNATRLLLEACQYRVTHVDLAGDAMVMLSNGKVKFDFVIADINSPDLHGFRLLQLAVSMGLPIIMLSVDDDMMMATKIIEIGAFMYMKRPTTPEMVRCLWQHVARENLRLMRERDTLMVPNYTTPRGIEFRDQHSGENPNNKGRHIEEEYDLDSNMRSRGKVKRKVCTEWTQELHDKFMNAVAQLGEGRCFPKDILELMNVPGLTRMQVASHLQKCRNDNWRSPEERKSTGGMNAMSSDGEGCGGQRPRKFGYMPRVGKYGQGSGGGQGWGGERDEGALVAHPSNSGSAFALDMDCVIQNISALPQPFADINPPRSFPLQPVYNHHQGGSMESRSQWTTTSETSNDYDTTKPNRDCTNN